ncbi:unnamed protein product [Cylicostephanus goldi]|uniref:Uncharacterized protein n=1 Tax=Cylicostephanus goldi TaxID=71465 RepID=A0A3P6TZL2_CYLGO|nr:unnamed protein product [Cylicostephanus goldi]
MYASRNPLYFLIPLLLVYLAAAQEEVNIEAAPVIAEDEASDGACLDILGGTVMDTMDTLTDSAVVMAILVDHMDHMGLAVFTAIHG